MLPIQEHAAFCLVCPTSQEVTACLNKLGLHLIFQMEAVRYPAYTPTPDLPAQFHFKDEHHGTEVIYLAGRDSGMDGEHFPIHASRFWITPGRDLLAFQNAAHELAERWGLCWQSAQKTILSSEHAA